VAGSVKSGISIELSISVVIAEHLHDRAGMSVSSPDEHQSGSDQIRRAPRRPTPYTVSGIPTGGKCLAECGDSKKELLSFLSTNFQIWLETVLLRDSLRATHDVC
jgi:hypothetical protein